MTTTRQRLRQLGGNIAKFVRKTGPTLLVGSPIVGAVAIGASTFEPFLSMSQSAGGLLGAAGAAIGGGAILLRKELKMIEDMGTKNPTHILEQAGKSANPSEYLKNQMDTMTSKEAIMLAKTAKGEEEWNKHDDPRYRSGKAVSRGVEALKRLDQSNPSQSASLSMA